MADDDNGTASSEQPATGGPASASSLMAKLSTNEQLIALGVLLILVVSDLIGDVFVDRYSVSSAVYVPAGLTLALIWVVKVRDGSAPVSYTWLLRSAGLAVTIFGVREVIGDLEPNNYLGGSNIIFALALYVGILLVAYGAYQLQGD